MLQILQQMDINLRVSSFKKIKTTVFSLELELKALLSLLCKRNTSAAVFCQSRLEPDTCSMLPY